MQHPNRLSRAAAVTRIGISCSPTMAGQSHDKELGRDKEFKAETQVKEARAGSGTRPGVAWPKGDFSQLFSLQSCPRFRDLALNTGTNPLGTGERGCRVCWCTKDPDTEN